MSRRTHTIERLLWLILIVVTLAAIAATATPPTLLRLVALSASGAMHEDCTIARSWSARQFEDRRIAARVVVANSSKAVARDGPLVQWASPYGGAWIRASQDDSATWAGDLHHWPPRWALQDVALPVNPVTPGAVVVDAGGHIGESTLNALAMGARLVVTIEPDPVNAAAIRRNLHDEIAAQRVIVVEKALWDKEGTLTLERHDASVRTTVEEKRPGGPAGGIDVPMITLDQIVRDLEMTAIDFIKMDIEGAEQHALRGATETLKRHKPILAIGSYHLPDDIVQIPRIVEDIEPSYVMTPMRCLTTRNQVFPHLLYFHVRHPATN